MSVSSGRVGAQASRWEYANLGSTVNVLSILKSPMILLGLVSMGIFIGMPYLMDNSKSCSLYLASSPLKDVMRLTAHYNSGPRDEEGVRREPEEQPDGQPHGRRWWSST